MRLPSRHVACTLNFSYCVMGLAIYEYEVQRAIKEARSLFFANLSDKVIERDLFGFSGIELNATYYAYRIYGLRVSEMRDDETLLEFRKRVYSMMNYPYLELVGIDLKLVDIDWHIVEDPMPGYLC